MQLCFGVLLRTVRRCGVFNSLAEQSERIEGFIAHWNLAPAHPFRWRFRARFAHHPDLRAA